jgi:hypothetical protein
MTIKWGLSVLDWRDHAVDDHQDYPSGALNARYGHWLMIVTPLRNKSCGKQWQECATAITPDTGTTSPP